jgi:hypothetical protein
VIARQSTGQYEFAPPLLFSLLFLEYGQIVLAIIRPTAAIKASPGYLFHSPTPTPNCGKAGTILMEQSAENFRGGGQHGVHQFLDEPGPNTLARGASGTVRTLRTLRPDCHVAAANLPFSTCFVARFVDRMGCFSPSL